MPTSSRKVLIILGILASVAAIVAACVAIIALIPEFGQWLFPRQPIGLTTTPLPPATVETKFSEETSTSFLTDSPYPTNPPTSTITALPPASTPITPTSSPTETVTPKPPALFETSFDNGWPDGMDVDRTKVDLVNGELLAHDFTLLSFGDDTWKNYQVEYEARKHTYCFGLKNNGVAAHAIDQDNMVMFSWNYCETGWFELVNGDWITITSGRDIIANPGTIIKIRLVAEGGNFTVYINNKKDSSYFNEKYTQGKAYILVSSSSVIDNIRISELP
jgi:hypothetical protein